MADHRVQKKAQNSLFKQANYFNTKNRLPFLSLHSKDLEIKGDSKDIYFSSPVGKIFKKDRMPVHYIANKGYFNNKKEILFLTGDTSLEDMESKITSTFLTYDIPAEKIFAKEKVESQRLFKKTGEEIFIDGDEMVSFIKDDKAIYTGHVTGVIKRKRVYEESIYFKAHKLFLYRPQSKIVLEENVVLKKQDVIAKSHRGEIFLENYNKNLKYYVLYDDVRVTEKIKKLDGTTFNRRSFSEKLEGIMSEDKIILTGYPKVFQEKDVIKGHKITLRENNEVVEVDDASSNFELK